MADPNITGPYRTALPFNQGAASMMIGAGRPQSTPIQRDPMAVLQAWSDKYAPMVKSLQDRRKTTEQQWLLNLASWKAQHRRQGFKGEWFNHFIPASRRSVERFITRVKQMLCPSPDFFEVFPADDKRHDLGAQAEGWKNYLLWRLVRNKIRTLISQWVRCFCLYGRAVARVYLDFEDVPGQAWPSVRVVDPFNFFVFPETASTEAQVRASFEHAMMSFDQYAALAAQGVCLPIREDELGRAEWPDYYADRLGRQGITSPADVRTGGPATQNPAGQPEKMVSLTEGWRRDTNGLWTQFWLVWNVAPGPRCVRVKSNQVYPYHLALSRSLPGEHYTNSMMSDLEAINVVLNDQFNMTLEGQAIAILPPAIVDPDMVANAASIVFRPRAKWAANPQGVSFMNPPNTIGAGFQGIQTSMGMMDSFSGSNPLAEGQPTRGMPRAGFAVSSMIGLSMGDMRDVAEALEDHILTPVLQAMARLTVEGMLPQQQIAQIPGSEVLAAAQYSMQQLIGGYGFQWVGSLQFQDQNVRAQRMLTALSQLAKMHPAMEKAGYTLDFPVLGKRLWRHGIGERGADTIIIPYNPPPPPPPQSEPPKVSVSISSKDLAPELTQAIALTGQPQLQGAPPPESLTPPPGQPQGVAPGIPPSSQPQPTPMPGTGGAERPAPASPEAAERQMGRSMGESSVAAELAGTGSG